MFEIHKFQVFWTRSWLTHQVDWVRVETCHGKKSQKPLSHARNVTLAAPLAMIERRINGQERSTQRATQSHPRARQHLNSIYLDKIQVRARDLNGMLSKGHSILILPQRRVIGRKAVQERTRVVWRFLQRSHNFYAFNLGLYFSNLYVTRKRIILRSTFSETKKLNLHF